MKTLNEYINKYIKENLDLENLFWKIDTWFMNRDEQKNKFIELVSLYKNKKAVKTELASWIEENNINIKEFVNFMSEDVITDNQDHIYQLCKIIDLVNANKEYKLQ